ncbi:hypothetical protein [Microbulbifer sp. GL-2]|uniref:hypothetical protein n=1 Tax=Microbulbifer sp. GL-2 TaxID=2591606 RepID=UPI00117E4190|nr:hypothetical protein [Microbulbifer sp. GL-2]
MSLKILNKQIEECRQDAEKQRRSAIRLINQQQREASKQLRAIPLPAMLGLAFAAGFIIEKLWQLPRTSQIVQLMLSMRTF